MTQAILNLTGTFLGARPTASVDPPVIVTPLDTTTLAPEIDWSRWGADPGDSSVRYTVTANFGGSPFSLTGATNIDGTSYTINPAFTIAVAYEIVVTATIGGVAQVSSVPAAFIKSTLSLGLVSAANLKFSQMRTADGANCLYLQYTALPGSFTSLVIVRLATGTYGVIAGMKGLCNARLLFDHPDGYTYMATNDPKNEIWRINRSTLTGVKVLTVATGVPRAFRRVVVAPTNPTVHNELVIFGSDDDAFPSLFHVDTDTLDILPSLEPGRGYVYFLLIDGTDPATYLAVPVVSYAPWLLRVLNPRTEAVAEYHDLDGDKGGTLYKRNSDGVVVYKRNLDPSGTAWETVIGGVVATLTPAPAESTLTQADKVSLGFDSNSANWDYDVNMAPASPTDITPAHIEYKLKADSTWSSLDLSGIDTAPIEPFKVQPFDSDTFVIVGAEYVPPYFWTPSTDARTVGGFGAGSLYAVLVVGTDIYYAGYDNEFYRHDTTAPWTLYSGHPSPTTANPRKLTSTGQKHLYLALDSSGRVWDVANSYRGAFGIYLHRYVPGTDVMTIYNIAPTSTSCTGMIVSTEGIIVALTESGVGKIKVINPETGALTREYTTLNVDPGLLIKLSETEVLCIEDFRYSRRNIVTGATVYAFTTTLELFGTHSYPYNRTAELHGTEVRLQVGNVMNSLNITTGALTPITGGASNPKKVAWLGSVAYAYNKAGFVENP